MVGAIGARDSVVRRVAFAVHIPLADADPPTHPVLFFNPKSGGGKAERFKLADEARDTRDRADRADLAATSSSSSRRSREGADGLAMAGGDGSQAVVAAVASELDLPYACIPAGTRNHFALDLGVDRDDVVGALGLVRRRRRAPSRSRRGQRTRFRQQRLARPLRGGCPTRGLSRGEVEDDPRHAARCARARGRGASTFAGPAPRPRALLGCAILVSNNRYRLGNAVGSGTRPRIDDGLLGVTVVSGDQLEGGETRQAAPATLARVVGAGIRGPRRWGRRRPASTARRSCSMRRFTSAFCPGVLRVRVARAHPGASPSAAMPESLAETGKKALIADRGRAVSYGSRRSSLAKKILEPW